MKKIFLLIVGILGFICFAFSSNDGWTLYKSENGVQIYHKKIQCENTANVENSQEMVAFKFVNTTDKEVTVNWCFDIWFGANCRTCGLPKDQKTNYIHSINLKAGQTLDGTCKDPVSSGLVLFSGFYKRDAGKNNPMTKFEMNDFSVKKK
ncbi:MAG: hypothetical protein HY958_03505 [Bacteroidia bacterium]|nr:hypothetical protein [Bacteroidia bacterium]